MPVYPIVREPVALTGRYPQMARRDAEIWERFLRAQGAEFTEVAYNVALGGSVVDDPEIPEDEVLGWQYVTAKKIDALLWKAAEVWIVEVKPHASLSAVGQVIGYQLLAEREDVTHLPLVPVIVTDSVDADVRYVADQLNITVVEA